MKKAITRSASETKKLAARLAEQILKSKPQKTAKVIGLVGDLGSGKTTFIQGFIKMLGVKQRITSPTFLIFRPYKIKKRGFYKMVYHTDLYRIHSFKELSSLGFQKILSNPRNVVLIEWAEKIRKLLPKNITWIKFNHGRQIHERIIEFQKQR